MTSPGPRRRPDPATMLSLGLLALLALLLLWPLLSGGPAPSPYLVGGLLLARLGLQLWRARSDERLRRPSSWALDLILIGLLFYAASGQPG
ncbi:hypothetical protein [Deinococcus petrolearius]|uniref:DUF3017 domain-containing protein n=1 Tax=Deinococcus petrolearius TaxID=1751295 RepID=A0ABW1DIL0_9DEIO